MESKTDSKITSNFSETIKLSQTFIATIVGAATVIAASGVVVLNSYIGRYTGMPIIGVPYQFYFTAGIVLFINSAVWILTAWVSVRLVKFIDTLTEPLNEKSSRWQKLLIFILSIAYLCFVCWWIYAYTETALASAIIIAPHLITSIIFTFAITSNITKRERFAKFIQSPFELASKCYKTGITLLVFMLYIAFYVFLIGSLFGSNAYGTLPSSIYGGEPTEVILTFADDEVGRFGLEASSQYNSETVCLLLPLQTELLIYDPESVTVLTIPKDSILSIRDGDHSIDCSPPNS